MFFICTSCKSLLPAVHFIDRRIKNFDESNLRNYNNTCDGCRNPPNKEYVSPEQVLHFVQDMKEFKEWVREYVPKNQQSISMIEYFVRDSYFTNEYKEKFMNCIEFLKLSNERITTRFYKHIAEMFIAQKNLFFN